MHRIDGYILVIGLKWIRVGVIFGNICNRFVCYFEQFSKGPQKCFERDGNLEARPEMMVLRRPNARPQRQCAFRLHESAVSEIGSPD